MPAKPHTAIPVHVYYPISDVHTSNTTISFPYFSFQLPGDSTVYRWQIHPVNDGPLRYTLIADHEDDNNCNHRDARIRAIYYHIGHEGSLFVPHSEGILLLPVLEDVHSLFIVSSLVGLLEQVRGMRKPKTRESKAKRSLLARLVKH